MASAYKRKVRKNGKLVEAENFTGRYKNWKGELAYFTGWPSKKKTLERARELEHEHRQISRGEREPPKQDRGSRPIDEVIAGYLAWGKTQGGRKGKPWDDQNAKLREGYLAWWKEALRLRTLLDIDLLVVEVKVQELVQSGLTPKSVTLRVESLKALCNWAVKRRFLRENPLVGLGKLDTEPEVPHRRFTDEEVHALLSVASPQRRLQYEAALATGLRVNELRHIRACDLDMSGPDLVLSSKITKNREKTRYPIPVELAERLSELASQMPRDAALLQISARANTASTWFQKDAKNAGIALETEEGKASWQSLRKANLSWHAAHGADVKTLQKLARHSSASLTMDVYVKTDQARMRASVERVWNAELSTEVTERRHDQEIDEKKSRSRLSERLYSMGDTGLEPDGQAGQLGVEGVTQDAVIPQDVAMCRSCGRSCPCPQNASPVTE